MPSPFPGMDPYLEQCWGDVHASLVLYVRNQLQGHLPKDLRARVEERVFVDAPQDNERNVYPDIRIVERGRGQSGTATATATAVRVSQPLIVELDDDPITERYIEIIDIGSGRAVVTVIEVLSPANKRPSTSRDKYVKKQSELIEGKVNLVEIDLLREGKWVVAVPPNKVPRARRTPYRVVVRRASKPGVAEVYTIALQDALPTIQVPLRATDADVPLDLQAVLERAYDDGAYEDDLDYECESDPPLEGDDAVWADAMLREKGVRKKPAPPRKKKRKET